MAGSPAPVLTGGNAHLVLYDGVCGLCSHGVQFLLERDRGAVFTFASLQSAVGRATIARFGGNPEELTSFHVVANYRTSHGQCLSRSDALLFVAGELEWPWKAAVLMRGLPTSLLDRLYDLVARHRYRVLGRHEQCLVPGPEFRARFIE